MLPSPHHCVLSQISGVAGVVVASAGPPGQRQGGPGERTRAAGARGADGHRAEELNRDGSAERDSPDRGGERVGLQPGGDAQAGQRGHVVRAYRAQRGAGHGQEDECSYAQPEP
jgi:hypothetical protein